MSWLRTGRAIYAKARDTKCGIIQPSKATSEPRMVCEGKPVETRFGPALDSLLTKNMICTFSRVLGRKVCRAA